MKTLFRRIDPVLAFLLVVAALATLIASKVAAQPKPVWTWRCLEKPEQITDALNQIYPESARDAKIFGQTYSTGEGYVATVWCIWYHQ